MVFVLKLLMVFSCWLLRPMFEMLKSGSNQNQQQQQPWRVNVQKNNSKLVQIQQQNTTTTTEIIISTPTLEKYNNKKSFIYVRAKHSPWRSEQDRHSDTRSDGQTRGIDMRSDNVS